MNYRERVFHILSSKAGIISRFIALFLLPLGAVENIMMDNKSVKTRNNEVFKLWWQMNQDKRKWKTLRSLFNFLDENWIVEFIEGNFSFFKFLSIRCPTQKYFSVRNQSTCILLLTDFVVDSHQI